MRPRRRFDPRLPIALAVGLGLGILATWAATRRAKPLFTSPGPKIENFTLLDQNGLAHELYRNKDADFIVLVSYARACPIARGSLPALNALARAYGAGVRFLLIAPSPGDDAGSLSKEAQDFAIDFPILIDDSQVVSRSLGVERTAEALVVRTRDWTLAYHGPIDDVYDYGFAKDRPRRSYLKEALDAARSGSPVPAGPTTAKGCLISYPRKRRTPPSYSAEVAPVLQSRCLSCHGAGALGFAMSDYKQVQAWAPMIKETILTRRMPPWFVDRTRSLPLQHDLALSPAEIRVIADWVEAGAPRGEGPDPLARAVLKPSENLGDPDLVWSAPAQQIPSDRTGTTIWRYETLSGPLDHDLWLRAVRFKPGNRAVVSHLRLLVLPQPLDAFRRRWGTVEPMGVYERYMAATWVPGVEATTYPTDAGVLLPKGSYPVLGFHYKTSGKAEADHSAVQLFFHHRPPRLRVRQWNIPGPKFSIPAGAAQFVVRAERRFASPLLLRGVSMHMHARGVSARFTAKLPSGEIVPLLSIPRFDVNWRWPYPFAHPLPLPAGTTIRVEGVFDNSARNPRNPDSSRDVANGTNQLTEEMFDGYLASLEEVR